MTSCALRLTRTANFRRIVDDIFLRLGMLAIDITFANDSAQAYMAKDQESKLGQNLTVSFSLRTPAQLQSTFEHT